MTLRQITLAGALFSVLTSFGLPAEAQEACEVTGKDILELGIWENSSARLKELSLIEVEGLCEDGELVIRGRAFTNCSPRDCKWGWVRGIRSYNGVLSFKFGGFFKALHVELRPMGSRIQAYVRTESHDPTILQQTRSYILVQQ